MSTEIPIFKRCCFFLPLRPGLLVWAYLKLILLTFLSVGMVMDMVFSSYFTREWHDWIRLIMAILITLCSLAITLLLIVSAHKKCPRLLRITYKCELGVAVAFLVMVVYRIIYDLVVYVYLPSYLLLVRAMAMLFLMSLLYTGVQLYVMVLIRSEVIKLESKHEFRFVNNAAEAECEYYEGQPPEYEEVLSTE